MKLQDISAEDLFDIFKDHIEHLGDYCKLVTLSDGNDYIVIEDHDYEIVCVMGMDGEFYNPDEDEIGKKARNVYDGNDEDYEEEDDD